ncbi:MAG: hypothetical protein J6328_01985 [Bacilli bacterium]|nr:hypothetical protein [Bacilli bacterium]
MRRLLSYLLLSSALLVGTAVSIAPTITNMNSDLSYSGGQTLTFRISEKEKGGERDFYDPIDNPDLNIGDDSAYDYVEKAAKMMRARLDVWGVSGYDVRTVGYNTVNVTVKPANETSLEYSRLEKYLAFSGRNLSLSAANIINTGGEDSASYPDEGLDELFVDQEAHIEYIEADNGPSYPVVVLPVSKKGDLRKNFNDLMEYCKDNTKEDDSSTEDVDESKSMDIILWGNRQESDVPAEGNVKTDDPNVASRIIFQEAGSPDRSVWYESSDSDKANPYLMLIPTTITSEDKSEPYREASFLLNMINAEELDYTVDFLYASNAAASVEDLVSLTGRHRIAAMGKTLIATLAAVIIFALVLAFFERINAVHMVAITGATTFLTFLLFTVFGAQFNIAALFGLIIIAALSAGSEIYFNAKVKEEIYRGRTLKKAATEGAKKALWPTIDASAVTVIIGIFTYLFAGDLASKLGIILASGGIISAFMNLVVYRFSSWLLYNDNCMQSSFPKMLSVKSDKIPDLMKEEKPSYKGALANKDFSKGKGWIGSIFGAITVAGIAMMIAFGVTKGSVYNDPTLGAQETEILFEIRTSALDIDASQKNDTEINSVTSFYKSYEYEADGTIDYTKPSNIEAKNSLLRNISYNGTSFDKFYASEDAIVSSISYSNEPFSTYDSENEVRYDWYFYSIKLPTFIDADETFKDEVFVVTDQNGVKDSFNQIGDALEHLVRSYYPNSNTDGSSNTPIIVSVNNIQKAESSPYLGDIALSVGVGLAVAMLYLMIRHGISRAVVASALTFVTSFLSIAFFVITRMPVSPSVAIGAIGTAVISMLIALVSMQKAKETAKDAGRDKTRTALEIKTDALLSAVSENAIEYMLLALLIGWLGFAYFFFGPAEFNMIYLALIVGTVFATLTAMSLFPTLANLLTVALSKIHIKLPQRKKKVGQLSEKRSKGSEPTEATFIGIND